MKVTLRFFWPSLLRRAGRDVSGIGELGVSCMLGCDRRSPRLQYMSASSQAHRVGMATATVLDGTAAPEDTPTADFAPLPPDYMPTAEFAPAESLPFHCKLCGGRKRQARSACLRPCAHGIVEADRSAVADGDPPVQGDVEGIGRFQCKACGGRKRQAAASCLGPCPRAALEADSSAGEEQDDGDEAPARQILQQPADYSAEEEEEEEAEDPPSLLTHSLAQAGVQAVGRFNCKACGGRKRQAAAACLGPCPRAALPTAARASDAEAPPALGAITTPLTIDLAPVAQHEEQPLQPVMPAAMPPSASSSAPDGAPPGLPAGLPAGAPAGMEEEDAWEGDERIGRFTCSQCGGRKQRARHACLGPCPLGALETEMEESEEDVEDERRRVKVARVRAASAAEEKSAWAAAAIGSSGDEPASVTRNEHSLPISLTRPVRLHSLGVTSALRKAVPVGVAYQVGRMPKPRPMDAYGRIPAPGWPMAEEPVRVDTPTMDHQHALLAMREAVRRYSPIPTPAQAKGLPPCVSQPSSDLHPVPLCVWPRRLLSPRSSHQGVASASQTKAKFASTLPPLAAPSKSKATKAANAAKAAAADSFLGFGDDTPLSPADQREEDLFERDLHTALAARASCPRVAAHAQGAGGEVERPVADASSAPASMGARVDGVRCSKCGGRKKATASPCLKPCARGLRLKATAATKTVQAAARSATAATSVGVAAKAGGGEEYVVGTFRCRQCGGQKRAKTGPCLAPCPNAGGGWLKRLTAANKEAPTAVGDGLRYRCRQCGGRKRIKSSSCQAPCQHGHVGSGPSTVMVVVGADDEDDEEEEEVWGELEDGYSDEERDIGANEEADDEDDEEAVDGEEAEEEAMEGGMLEEDGSMAEEGRRREKAGEGSMAEEGRRREKAGEGSMAEEGDAESVALSAEMVDLISGDEAADEMVDLISGDGDGLDDVAELPYGCRMCGGRKRAKKLSCLMPCPAGTVAPVRSAGTSTAQSMKPKTAETGSFRCHVCGGSKRAARCNCSNPCPGGSVVAASPAARPSLEANKAGQAEPASSRKAPAAFRCHVCGGSKRAARCNCSNPCPGGSVAAAASVAQHVTQVAHGLVEAEGMVAAVYEDRQAVEALERCMVVQVGEQPFGSSPTARQQPSSFRCGACGGQKRAARSNCLEPCSGGAGTSAVERDEEEDAEDAETGRWASAAQEQQARTAAAIAAAKAEAEEEAEMADADAAVEMHDADQQHRVQQQATFRCHQCGGRKRAARCTCLQPCPGGTAAVALGGHEQERLLPGPAASSFRCHVCGGAKRAARCNCLQPCPGGQAAVEPVAVVEPAVAVQNTLSSGMVADGSAADEESDDDVEDAVQEVMMDVETRPGLVGRFECERCGGRKHAAASVCAQPCLLAPSRHDDAQPGGTGTSAVGRDESDESDDEEAAGETGWPANEAQGAPSGASQDMAMEDEEAALLTSAAGEQPQPHQPHQPHQPQHAGDAEAAEVDPQEQSAVTNLSDARAAQAGIQAEACCSDGYSDGYSEVGSEASSSGDSEVAEAVAAEALEAVGVA